MSTMKHPFHTRHTVIGSNFESLNDFVLDIPFRVESTEWLKCKIGERLGGKPYVELNSDPNHIYLFGEIGLSYICYRLRDIVDRADALNLFRCKSYGALSALLTAGLGRLTIHGSEHRPVYKMIILDEELVSILTQYRAVANSIITFMIDKSHLNKRVVWWRWRPTELRVRLQAGIFKRFKFGIRIRNGETGHAALSYHSMLWVDSAEGMTHIFSTPCHERGYARHMPTSRLQSTLDNLSATLEENAMVEAFEQMAGIPGKWGLDFINRNLWLTKGREITKEKLQVAFEDDVSLYYKDGTHTTQDLVALLLDTGALINKSAALIANQIVTLIIKDIMSLPIKVTGEVITQ